MSVSLNSLVTDAVTRFSQAGIESAQVDAELLLAFVLKLSRSQLQSEMVLNTFQLQDQQVDAFEHFVSRRERREPLQHLTGTAYFRQLELKVGKGVFIPRPETEFVTELAIAGLRERNLDSPIVVDLCAGSGAVGLAIATEVSGARVFAVEKSPDAFHYAKENYLKLSPDSTVLLGDMDGALQELNGKVDWLISNPPYIPADMIPVYPEVALHDPSLALYAGADGLELIRLVSKNALRLLKSGGGLTIEHADMQGTQVRQLLLDDGWQNVFTHQDFNGRDRAVTATR